jgi:hypothetical protein
MELVVTSCPVAGMDRALEWSTGGGTVESIGMVATKGGRTKILHIR